VLNLWPRYWSHLGDTFAAVGVIAFTLASLLVVDLGLNWRELTSRRADYRRDSHEQIVTIKSPSQASKISESVYSNEP
jgi:hypothetical protein